MAADGPGLVAGSYTVVMPISEFVGKPTCTSLLANEGSLELY